MEQADKTLPPSTGPDSSRASFSWGTFSEDFWFRYSRQIVIALIVIVAAAAGWFGWKHLRAQAEEADNKRLGTVYILLHDQNLPAAEQALVAFLAENPSGLARDKANLLLGKAYYGQQRYDEALAAYGKVGKGGKSTALLHAGALHGTAAAHMQKAEYAQAVEALDQLVAAYGGRTGDPEENLAGSEAVDFAPSVPNALWKLALCHRELGQAEQAKAAAERLIKAYPGSREARDAEKLLTVL
jgi:TolA-binding protein